MQTPPVQNGPPSDAAERLMRLQALTAALLEAMTSEEAADAILTHSLSVLGADAGVIYRLNDDGSEFLALRMAGYSAEVAEAWSRFPADARTPIADAVRECRVVIVPTRAEMKERYPIAARFPTLQGEASALALPLIVRGRAIGGLGLRFSTDRTFSDADRAFLLALAGLCAQALDRARLYDMERAARERAERAEVVLRQSETLLRRILDSNAIGLIVTDSQGRIIKANDAFLNMVGYDRADLGAGRVNFVALTPPEYRLLDERAIVEMMRVGRHEPFEKEYIRKDGSRVPVLVGTAHLGGESGQDRGIGFIIDLTEQRRAQTALRESEERLRSLSNNLPNGAIYQVGAGPHGGRRFLYISAGIERLIGVTPAEAMADAAVLYGLIHEEDRRLVAAAEEAAVRALAAYDCEFRSWTRRGDVRWFHCRSAPRRLPSGELVWEGVILDVTGWKRNEALMEGQRQVLELMVRGAPLPDVLEALCQIIEEQAGERLIATVLLLDEDGVHLRPVAGGRSPEGWTRAIDPLPIGPCVGSCGTAAYRAEQVIATDIGTDGRWTGFRDLALSYGLRACWSTPILSSQGRVLGTFAVYYDTPRHPDPSDLRRVDLVTRTAGIAVERHRADEALREASRRKDDFLATLAHELRNPLAPLRNGLQVLKLARGDIEAIEQAQGMMERQLGQMVHLIDDLLDMSRITRGKLQLRKERVALASVVGSAVEGSRPLIEASEHRLTVTLPSEPIYLHADPTRLAQVFANLLTNAAKYTDSGGQLRLVAQRHGDEIVVAVRDTGIGIAAEHLPRLFEMFSQVAPALERSQGGLGIGLSLVKGLVEMHGGTVEARSEGPGQGSEFLVRLPISAAPHAPPSPSCDRDATGGRPGRRILVADDKRDAADSLAIMLRLAGHDVYAVHDGQQAIEEAARLRPDVALLDIGMPKLNGLQAARHIRAQPWGREMVLVAITGWGQAEDKRRATEAGFDLHLTKPVDPAALEELLADLALRG